MADRRGLLKSRLQKLIREVFEEGWEFGIDNLPSTECGYAESEEAHARHDEKLHELLISYFDDPSSHVGAQDEASEAREMGDGVRSEGNLMPNFVYKGERAPIGHCEVRMLPNGDIIGHAKYV